MLLIYSGSTKSEVLGDKQTTLPGAHASIDIQHSWLERDNSHENGKCFFTVASVLAGKSIVDKHVSTCEGHVLVSIVVLWLCYVYK